MKFKVGDKVNKVAGYSFPGSVRAAFTTEEGEARYVVQLQEYGLLHIFNESQLYKAGT